MTVYYSKWGTYYQNRDSGGGTRLDRIDDAPSSFWEGKKSRKVKGGRTSRTVAPSQKRTSIPINLPKDLNELRFKNVKHVSYGRGIIVDVDEGRCVRVVFKGQTTVKSYNRQDFENRVIELVGDTLSSKENNGASKSIRVATDVRTLLGDLLYRCQRIEWQMKELLEKSSCKIVLEKPSDIANIALNESWKDNKDTLGVVAQKYIECFYGEQKVDIFPDGVYGVSIQISFNSDALPEARELARNRRTEQLKTLVNMRNFLAHGIGLKYDLDKDADQIKVMDLLNEAVRVIASTESLLQTDLDLFKMLVARFRASIPAIVQKVSAKTTAKSTSQIPSSGIVPDKNPIVVLLMQHGFTMPESKAMYYVLLMSCTGDWVPGGFFSNELKKYIPDFSYAGRTLNRQSKLMDLLKCHGYVDLKGDPPYFKVLHL